MVPWLFYTGLAFRFRTLELSALQSLLKKKRFRVYRPLVEGCGRLMVQGFAFRDVCPSVHGFAFKV